MDRQMIDEYGINFVVDKLSPNYSDNIRRHSVYARQRITEACEIHMPCTIEFFELIEIELPEAMAKYNEEYRVFAKVYK